MALVNRQGADRVRGGRAGTRSSKTRVSVIYILYTLGLVVALSVQEREHGRFRGSSEGMGAVRYIIKWDPAQHLGA